MVLDLAHSEIRRQITSKQMKEYISHTIVNAGVAVP